MIVCGQRAVAPLLEFTYAGLDYGLVDAYNRMMLVYVDAQRRAKSNHQMLLVKLRVAFDGFVIDVFRNVTQLGKRLVLQFVVCVSHGAPYSMRQENMNVFEETLDNLYRFMWTLKDKLPRVARRMTDLDVLFQGFDIKAMKALSSVC